MLSDLPASWLIVIGMVLCLFLMIIFRRVRIFLTALFKPYKKGKSYWCRVSAISDGDTLTCYRLNLRRSETKLRFAYVDAKSKRVESATSG